MIGVGKHAFETVHGPQTLGVRTDEAHEFLAGAIRLFENHSSSRRQRAVSRSQEMPEDVISTKSPLGDGEPSDS